MADKYTIQINPQISATDALKMERDLNSRFGNVAKKFGTNFGNALKSAAKIGLGAAAAGITAAILTNPFEKIDEDLNKTLEKADNLATRAAQFGVSTAKFSQLASVASSVGLDVDLALQQFASLRDEAKQFAAGDQTKNNALANFTQDKDVIDSFYAFIQTMQSLAPEQRNLEVSRVYGDKMGLKIAELLQQNIEERKKQVLPKGVSAEKVGQAADLLAAREDQQAILRAQRENRELVLKSAAITGGTLKSQDAVANAKLRTQTQQLTEYQIYAKQAMLQERISKTLDELRADIVSTIIPLAERAVNAIEGIWGWFNNKIEQIKQKGILKGIFS